MTDDEPTKLYSVVGNRYRLHKSIGEGSFGIVYEAEDLNFKKERRLVAIKILREEHRQNPEFLASFENEASILVRLTHQNILRVFDFSSENPSYLVTELVNGGTLNEKLRPDPKKPMVRIPLVEVARYLEQISAGLDKAHEIGLVHRDLKPQNILLDKDDRPLIADFGLATAVSITKTFELVDVIPAGTAPFMAPEQWKGQVGKTSDIYALTVMSYQMITGQLPYKGDAFELMGQHLYSPVPTISEKAKDLEYPPELDKIIADGMNKDPEKRTRPATKFANLFNEAVTAFIKQQEAKLHGYIPPLQNQVYPGNNFSKGSPPQNNLPGQAIQGYAPIPAIHNQFQVPIQPNPVTSIPSLQNGSNNKLNIPLILVAAALFVLILVGVGVWYLFGNTSQPISQAAIVSTATVTTSATVTPLATSTPAPFTPTVLPATTFTTLPTTVKSTPTKVLSTVTPIPPTNTPVPTPIYPAVPESLARYRARGQITFTAVTLPPGQSNCLRWTADDNGNIQNHVLIYCNWTDTIQFKYPTISMPEPTRLVLTNLGEISFDIYEDYEDTYTYAVANKNNSPDGLALFVTGSKAEITVNGIKYDLQSPGNPDYLQFPIPKGWEGHYSIDIKVNDNAGNVNLWLGEIQHPEKNTVPSPK